MPSENNTYSVFTFKRMVPGVLWFLLIDFLMFLPGRNIPQIGWLEGIYFDKWVHTGSFLWMVVLFCWPFYRSAYSPNQRIHYFLKIAIAASIWGLIVEFIQRFYIPGRSYDLLDWAADSFGALAGFLVSRKYLSKP